MAENNLAATPHGHRPGPRRGDTSKAQGYCPSEFQFPSFCYKILSSPGVVGLLVDQLKAGLFINSSRTLEFALRPKHNLPVANLAGEADTLFDQAFADSQTARGGFHE